MVTSHQVQEFLNARRQGSTDSETVQNARRALLASDKQGSNEEGRATALDGLALLYGREATEAILRWINDSSPTVHFSVSIFTARFEASSWFGPTCSTS